MRLSDDHYEGKKTDSIHENIGIATKISDHNVFSKEQTEPAQPADVVVSSDKTWYISTKQINILLQGLDVLVTHHNELGLGIEELHEATILARDLDLISTDLMGRVKVPMSFFKNTTGNEPRGFGSH
jgi:hypothetical protein